MYSPSSRANSLIQPGRKILSSEDVCWTSSLLEVWDQPGTVGEFTTISTPDQVLVLTAAGDYNIESYARGRWHRALYGPGKGGATAPLNVSRLRWASSQSSSIRTLHLYLPQEFLEEAGEEYRRAGKALSPATVDFLTMDDPWVYETISALSRGIMCEAPDLYCNTACRMLAVHLLLLNGKVAACDLTRDIGRDFTDRRLSRVLDYMHQNVTKSISLDQLAREAGISRFHFVRLFQRKVGMAPHQYLVEQRLKKAARLLQTSDLDISTISSECGFSHAGRFAAAFRRRFKLNPAQFRRART